MGAEFCTDRQADMMKLIVILAVSQTCLRFALLELLWFAFYGDRVSDKNFFRYRRS